MLLDSGFFAQAVADQLGLNVRTTHIRWRHNAFASLPDKPRSGAPQKLDATHMVRLVQWAKDEPLTAPALLTRHLDAGGPSVHVNTLVRKLKVSGMVWKRTRHSLEQVATKTPSAKQP